MSNELRPAYQLHLALGTVSFTLCFAAWGLMSAFAPEFRKLFQLSATQSAALVAAPVLLGSLARIPLGMLTDRLGGRLVFSVLMALCAVPAFLVPLAGGYHQLLWVGFFLGMAGSSFAVGIGYVSRWTPPAQQGSALGVYGLGNIGQSAAVFLGPVVAASMGWPSVYRGTAILLLVWGGVFALLARNAPRAPRPAGFREMVTVLTRESTGPWLAEQSAVLAIQPFNPEVFSRLCQVGDDCDAVLGSPQLLDLVEWKRRFVSSWVDTGIPVMLDVSPGFDARVVFADSPRYGNNAPWRSGQSDLLSLGVRGLTANTWNGYTEGYAVVPSCSAAAPPGLPPCPDRTGADVAYFWFKELTPPGGTRAQRLPATLVGSNPSNAVYSDPIALTFRLTSFNLPQALFGTPDRVPLSNRAVRVRVGDKEAQGTTRDDGVVSVTITIGQQPGEVPLVASFDGDAESLAIAVQSSLRVEKERTSVQWLAEADQTVVDGPGVRVSARLSDDDGQPVGARTVVITVDSEADARTCSGVTDADGVARCNVVLSRHVGPRAVSMQFAGDAYYESATAQLEVDLNPSRE